MNVTDGNADIYTIGTSDSLTGVPFYAQWAIQWGEWGYVIKNDGDDDSTLQVECDSAALLANVIVGTSSASTFSCEWDFEEVVSPPEGVVLYDTDTGTAVSSPTRYVAPQETRALSALRVAPTFYSGLYIGQEFEWSSSNESIATVDEDTGAVTGVSTGTTIITGVPKYSNIDDSVSFTVNVTNIPIGTYRLRNKETKLYADIHADENGLVMANGTAIVQNNFSAGLSQQWIFTLLDDGYYAIKSNNSSTAYYLGVANASGQSNASIVLRTGTITDEMKWRFAVTDSGAFKIIPKTGEQNRLVLATSTSDETNGVPLIQGVYINNTSYRDEWFIHQVTYAMSVGGDFYDGQDVIDAANNWQSCGYDSYYDINPSVTTLDFDALNSEVVYFSSHGQQHFLELLNGVVLSDGSTEVTSGTVEINNFTLPKATLYIYDACLTASNRDGTGKNLCTETIASGVSCVIGWTKPILDSDARVWQIHFQNKLIAGESVKSAADYANTFSYVNNSTIKSWRIYGDQNLIVKQYYVTDPPANEDFNDASIKSVSIQYPTHDIDILQSILKTEFADFSTDTARAKITYTNAEKTNYVIDYCFYRDRLYLTNSGYSIIVNNGIIVYIRDNTIDAQNSSSRHTPSTVPQITDEIVSAAYLQAAMEISNLGTNYSIAEQFSDQYYDIINDKYYYRIMSVCKTPNGAYCTTLTMYEL